MTQGVLFTPTAEQRNQVEVLSGFGVPHSHIAVLLGCDAKTLRKHFESELAVGNAKATAKIAQTLFNKAVSGDTASLIFWLKARAGWRERVVQEHTGADGEGPMSLQVSFVGRPAGETREQWIGGRQSGPDQRRAALEAPPRAPTGSPRDGDGSL